MEGPEIKAVEAVIDNGSFGKRTLRFETGRLAQQADGGRFRHLHGGPALPLLAGIHLLFLLEPGHRLLEMSGGM